MRRTLWHETIIAVLSVAALLGFTACRKDTGAADSRGENLSMDSQAPNSGPLKIRLVPDDYHIERAGTAEDGSRFFITGLFVARTDHDPGCEYVATFRWNSNGTFREAKITSLGPRATLADGRYDEAVMAHAKALGKFVICPIAVAPFRIERNGVTFGLIHSTFEGFESVELQPGNHLAFTPPWDGRYDT